ncbi:MAG: sugar-binding domain-containing protein, partial [Anaerolineales bacterium]
MTDSFWLADGAATLALDGAWEFQLGDASPRALPVPGAWEAHLTDKATDGPARYRRSFDLPADWLTRHIRLEADAISYHATIRINGQLVGTHSGMWSPFQLDITPFVRAGRNEVEIEVWKPGSRFPVRSTLAGFLPDVCNTLGGVWQPSRLRAFSGAAFTDLRLHADDTGRLSIAGAVWSEGSITHAIVEAGGATARAEVRDGRFSLELTLTDMPRWNPGAEDARLVPVTVSAYSGEHVLATRTQRIGFRSVRAEGEHTRFNGQP